MPSCAPTPYLQSIGLISISTFPAAAILLTGLFCYDIFWVFGTEVMVRSVELCSMCHRLTLEYGAIDCAVA